MKDILIHHDNDGMVMLTTDSPLSCYNIPVLRIKTAQISGDFRPSDWLPILVIKYLLLGDFLKMFTAAGLVAAWAREPNRTPEEIEVAKKFLSQWPEGPQIT